MKFCLLSAADFSGKSFDALVLLNNFLVKIVFNSQRQLVFSILHPVWCRGHCFPLHRPYFALQGPPNSFPTHPQWEWILPVSAKKNIFQLRSICYLKSSQNCLNFEKLAGKGLTFDVSLGSPFCPSNPGNPGKPEFPFCPGSPGSPGKPGFPFCPGSPGKPSRPWKWRFILVNYKGRLFLSRIFTLHFFCKMTYT